MKKRILFFFALVLCFTNTSFSQSGLSDAIITQTGNGATVEFANPHGSGNSSFPARLILGTVDGDPTEFYCVDITRTISFPDSCHHDSAVADSKIVYILNNYYPFNPNPIGELSDLDKEVAATQVAIWHFSDGVNLSTVTPNDIRDRAIEIANDANTNGGNTTVFNTIEILPDANPDDFYVRTLDENGNPIAINNIQLSITSGSLSTNVTLTTLPSGISDPVIVTGASSNSIIKAEADAIIPQGITYTCPGSQRLVLALPVIAKKEALLDWGALPVELSAFSSFVNNRNVVLSWLTVSESNNSGFNIERRLAGNINWNVVGNVAGNGTSNLSHSYNFTDRNLESGKYIYRLKQVDLNGNFEYHNLVNEVEVGVPSKFNLSQNYPNPFNPSTKINFELATEGNVSIKIFDNLGREVSTLINEFKTAGYYTFDFNASNLPSGLYFYRMDATGFNKVMKMTLVK
ncbi:MAG: Cys-Gln thioester bond-forming surface protein [Bacteroidota bacterium]|nr:Cys-Gln thioester bond-forming surface protein [Bacteroidota bacterium]